MNQEKLAGKREWTDPALVVLVRNRPEEAVLTGCKTYTTNVLDKPIAIDGDCSNLDCDGGCSALVSS